MVRKLLARRRRRKENKELADGDEVGEKRKGKFSLKDKVELEKEFDEYYKLDYEDTIGDLKTRFKYRQVEPNSYGLKTYEILQSDDRDLNQYVPIKKLAPYREDEWQVTHHKMKNKASILGGQKIEDKKVKAHKKSKSEECPSSEKPRKDKLISEQEEAYVKKVKTGKRSRSEEDPSSEEPEKDNQASGHEGTDAKQKTSRSKRRNRRKKELHIPPNRREAYGI